MFACSISVKSATALRKIQWLIFLPHFNDKAIRSTDLLGFNDAFGTAHAPVLPVLLLAAVYPSDAPP